METSDENHINKIVFSDEVQNAIEQVLQSSDPLDSPDFNSIDYINQLFPTEQSLSNIDDVIAKMETEVSSIDDHIRSVVRSQSNTGQEGLAVLQEAQKVIVQLFSQIVEIKTRAERTEDMVREITRDIKQLDCSKKNLTSAITTLNHLHMLVGGVESLIKLAEKRQYRELLNPLQAITEVNQHFQQYTDIAQIKAILKTNKWREEYGVKSLPTTPAILNNADKARVLKHRDCSGRPVIYIPAKNHNASTRDIDEITKFIVNCLEEACERCFEEVIDNLCIVFDLADFSTSCMDLSIDQEFDLAAEQTLSRTAWHLFDYKFSDNLFNGVASYQRMVRRKHIQQSHLC